MSLMTVDQNVKEFSKVRMRMIFPVFEKRTTISSVSASVRWEKMKKTKGVKSSRQLKKIREVNKALRNRSCDFSLVILKLN